MNDWKLVEAKRIEHNRVVCKALVPYGVLTCYGWRMKINRKSAIDQKTVLQVQFTVQIFPDDPAYNTVVMDYKLLEDPKIIELEYVYGWFVRTVSDTIIYDMFKAIQ